MPADTFSPDISTAGRPATATASRATSLPVLARDLADRRLPALGLAAALAVVTVGALGAASGLEDTISDLTEDFPEALTAFLPVDVPGGYVTGEVFHLLAPLALVAYAVLTGASATAGEERTGTLSLLSAQPVSRRAVLGGKLAGLLATLTGLVAVFVGTAIAAAALFDIGLAAPDVVATGVHLLLLTVLFGSLAVAVGAATGNPSLAAGAAGALAAVAYVSDAMLPLADLDGWARLSPWHYYTGSEPLTNGLDAVHLLVLAALTAVALAVAFATFVRRDLKG